MSHKSGVWKFFTGSSRAHCTLCTSCSRGKERGSTEYKYSLILVTSTGKKEVPNWCVCFSNHCNMHGKFHELKTLVKQACRPMLLCSERQVERRLGVRDFASDPAWNQSDLRCPA